MKPLLHYSGFLLSIDGLLHMLFPNSWDTLLLTATRRTLPAIGRHVERAYLSAAARRGSVGSARARYQCGWAAPPTKSAMR